MNQKIRLLLLGTCVAALSVSAQYQWDGDNALGNFTYNNNWYSDSQPAWGFGGNLQFEFNNGSASTLYWDYGAWKTANNILFQPTFDDTYSGTITWNGDGSGLDFKQKLENYSGQTVVINSMNLSGGKDGATSIQLNPVNGNLTLSGTLYNDFSNDYEVYGNNGKTLTLNTALGVGGTAANVRFRVQQNSTVIINAAQNWNEGTEVNAGTLEISNTNALGGGYLAIANSGTFRYTGTGTQTDGRNLWIDTSTDTKTIEITSGTGVLEFTGNGGNVNKPLTKTGAGRLTIADDINSGAAVTVSAGTFRIGNGGGNGNLAGGASVTGAGALEFYKTGNTTVGGTFGGSGPIRFMSTGASSQGHFQLDGNSSAYTGAVTIDLARLHLNNVNDVGSASSITVNNLGQAWISGGANIARPLSITGIGWAEGAGNLGAIRIDSASTYSGAITLAGNARITTYGGGDTGTISGVVSDGASSFELEKSGDGVLYLSNSGNTHDGGTKVSGGYLRITSDGALGSTTGPLILQTNGRIMGGTLAAGANVSLNASRPISLPNGDGYFHIWTGYTMDVPGPISGSGNMRKSDGGTLNFSGTGSVGTLRIEGGTFQQSGGSLNAGSNLSMSSTSTLSITGGTLSTGRLVTSDNSGVLSIINQSAGTFNVTGSVNSGTSSSFLLNHWGASGAASTYNLSGGVLNAPNAPLNLGWDGTARLNQTGGTANLQGINFNNGKNNGATYLLTSGRLNIGTYGMNGNASAKWLQLNGGTLGAYANWTGSQQINVSATSTIDTLDSVDGLTGRTITLSGVLSGAGGITKAGAGTLILNNAANTYTGATTINAGTFQIGGGGRLNNGAYAATITNNGVLYYNSTANQTLSGAIGGTGSLVKASTGNLTLSTANGYTGGTTVNAGTLTLSYNSGGTGTIRDGLTVNSGGTVVLAVSNALGWSGSNWVKTANVNGGTVRTDVNGDNGWDITWNLNGGTLSNTNNGYYSINNTGGVFVTGNTTSTISGRIQLRGSAVNFNVADGTADQDLLVSGEVFNNAGLQKTGAGKMVMTATNTYSGDTSIGAGTLEIGGGGSLGSGSYAGTLTNNGTLNINTTANQTLSGVMSGTGSLVKNSTGILTLTGNKTYSGLTTVNAGVLTASGAGTFTSTSGLAVADGAIFNYLPDTVGSALTMGAGSTLNLEGGSILGLNWNAATASKIVASGAATIGANVKVSMIGSYTSGQPYTILQAGSGLDGGSYTAINNVDYTASFGQSATAVTITPTTVTPLSSAYWKGGTSGYESVMGVAGNWTTDGAGTVSGLTPGAGANVFFSDSGAAPANQLDMTLGANMALNSLTVNGNSGSPVNTSPVSISSAGGYTLTLGSGAGAGIFVNTGSGQVTVNTPVVMGVNQTWSNNSGSALTVNGAVSGSASLTKSGTGLLVLAGANTYSGTTTVSQGTLRLGAATGLPSNNNITVASGATFDFNGQGNSTTRNYNFTISGTGVGGQGAINNTSGTAIYGNSSLASLTLAGNASIGTNGRWDIGDGSAGRTLNGGGFALTKVGTGEITFRPQTVSNLAAVNINAGILKFEGFDQTTGATSGMTVTTNTGGTLSSYGNRSFNMPLVFAGGSMANESGTANWSGTVAFNAPTTINTTQTINFTGAISGSGNITRTGGGTVSFGGDISGYTGNITSSANLVFNRAAGQILNGNITATGAIYADVGVLNLASSGSMTASNYVIARSGGTLEFNRSATLTGAGYLGTDTGTGTSTININAGKLVTHNGSNGMIIGQNTANHNGVLNVSGTYVQNVGSAMFGNNQPGATGTLNVNSGGTVTFGAGMNTPGASGGGGILGVVLGRDNATAVGTFNLNAGGILESAKGMVRGTGQGYFNFNGGTLRALGNTTAFLDVTTTTVNSGGAVVDSNGFDVTIADGLTAGTGSGGLTKNGTGVLTLSGANTYTGVTAVNAGAVTISGAGTLSATSAVNVADGAQFNYSPASPGTLSLAGATLNLASGSTFGTTWGSTIAAAGAATVGGSDIGIEMLSGSFTSGTPYTVLTAASGLTSGAYVLRNNYNYIATIDSSSGTSVILTPTAVAALTSAYWKGGLSGQVNVWAASDGSSTSNWVGTSGGADQPLTPGAGADVVISNSTLNTAPTSTVLGANMSIKTLTISDTNNGLGLNADGYKLTITPASSSAGITVTAGVPASNIGSNIGLGASQTWTNNSSGPLTVSGGLSGGGALTITGSSPVVLSGANVNTSGISVISGTLSVGSISDSGTSNIGNAGGAGNFFAMINGTLRYTGTGTQSSSRAIWVDQAQTGSTFDITQASGNLTLSNSGGTINKNVTKTGPGSLTLGGVVNGTMSLAVNQGTLTLTGDTIDYNGATTVSGGRLVLYNNDDTWTSGLNISSGAAVEIYRDNSTPYEHRGAFTLSGAGTLEKTGNGAASMSWDQGGTVAMASGGLIHVKGGTLRLEYGQLSNWASNLADMTVDSGATFDMWDNNNAGVFVDSLNGAGTITRTTYAQTSTLTVGVDNGGGTFSGNIANAAGVINLTKTGSGTQTLSGNNTYSGTTTISNGLLIASGGNGIGDGSVVSILDSATAALQITHTEEVGLLSGGGASGGNITLANGITLTTGNQGGSASYDGIISGPGASLQKRGGGNQTLTGNNSFTGGVTIQNGTLTVPSISATGVNQPLGAGATPIVFSGSSGTLAITGSGTTSRGLTLSTGASTLSVGGTVNFTGAITGGDSGASFTKAGAGTFNYSGTGSWNANLNVTGGAFELSGAGGIPSAGVTTLSSGASLRINTTGVMQASRVTAAAGATVALEAGTLRVAGGDLGGSPVYSIDNSGSFAWGTGTTLAVFGGKSSGQADRTALAGAASGPTLKEGNYLFVKNDLTQPAGSTLDLGGLYGSSDALRYNQLHVTGALTIDDGASLKLDLNPYYLRPFGANVQYTGDWGTMVLAYAAGGITGDYDFSNVLGITSDRIGWTRVADQTDSYFDPASLALDTYMIEYRTGSGSGFNFVQAGGAILLHYKVSGTVPEPASAGMLIAGALLLRALRRRKG